MLHEVGGGGHDGSDKETTVPLRSISIINLVYPISAHHSSGVRAVSFLSVLNALLASFVIVVRFSSNTVL